ncbi:thioredoxin-disulfide reductase [Candidatus Dependentiae bacterium]|nr:thioredoxin-disulfide reductase [Candidatus Dependentiae bacterium]
MPEKIEKTIIIGSGPAGLTAGIYLGRAKQKPLLIEGRQPGGQLTTTTKVENWPGDKEIQGFKLMMNMKEHAKNSGCEIISDTVTKIDLSKKPYTVFTKSEKELKAESIIIATGATHKKLGIPGEEEYWSKGVSVCATCDAPFFQDKNVIIVGGGDSAVTEAEHLRNFAKKVTIIHILEELTATDPIKDKILEDPKVEIIYNSTLTKIEGDGEKATKVEIEHQKTNDKKTLETDGVFIAIGMKPNTEFLKDQIELDEYGYIILKEKTSTSKEGVFAAGDVHDYVYKQAITASGFGCMAALDCQKYLGKK